MRSNYLKEHKKSKYTIIFTENTILDHLKEMQETAIKRVNQIVDDLKTKNNLIEDTKNTNMLYLLKMMNAIKEQAEEIILNELIYI